MTGDPTLFNPDDTTAENKRLTFALQAAGVGTWDLDITNQQVWWDDCCKRLYGFNQQDVVPYQQVLHYMHPDDQVRVNTAIRWALNPESGGEYDIHFRIHRANNGLLRWLHCRGKAYFNADRIAYRFSVIAQDVTPQPSRHDSWWCNAFRPLLKRRLWASSLPPQTVRYCWLMKRIAN